jgi:uncharacterized membrane protein YoaK (UPF0700 family)
MSPETSSMHGSAMPQQETLAAALLLAFAGGYLDTYTWITHGILANAQTANLVFLWVHATAGRWQQAFHFIPPLFAFFVGVVITTWLRRVAGERAGQLSLLGEIAMLILVGILHNRMPEVAGTLGISMVAAMQSSIFTRVEGTIYSSVMITGNFRQAIEGSFALLAGDRPEGSLRKSSVFMGVCAAFGTGAAAGAFLTERLPASTLTVPAAALLLVLVLCRAGGPLDAAEQRTNRGGP